MIAAHRRAHRRIHVLLWPAVGLLLAAALATRRPVDAPSDWPGFLAENAESRATGAETRTGIDAASSSRRASDREAPRWSREDAFGAWPARLSRLADGRLEIRPHRPLDRPELLVYWLPGAFDGARLPDDARLLGRLTGSHAQRFALPPEVATADASGVDDDETGTLVLFSLGHGEIVATARLAPEAR